ncbi:hypothetical protein GCM10017744_100370 [Streptomyces antimycoticus]|uniref:Uncharacterized protein n=1 Tax=Streptomyces antimycoticus TaxID=68175 RepID=A0A4D4JUJ0_9ACTN|nr:hypothetical protein SANT12839_012770 [Streptomyces antimycoticus]
MIRRSVTMALERYGYRVHAGRHYAIQFHYALPDDMWCVELSEAVPAPAAAAWAETPRAETHLPGAALLVAVIPDEDPDLEPAVHIHGHDEHLTPYEVMCCGTTRLPSKRSRPHRLLAVRVGAGIRRPVAAWVRSVRGAPGAQRRDRDGRKGVCPALLQPPSPMPRRWSPPC